MDDNKRIFSELIKRQIAILGPDITLAKVKNVSGIQVDANGDVLSINGDPQVLLNELIAQFVELSGLIVKKTMESILSSNPSGASLLGAQVTAAVPPPVVAQPEAPVTQPAQPAQQDNKALENNPDLASANKDIEDLNKMLNNMH